MRQTISDLGELHGSLCPRLQYNDVKIRLGITAKITIATVVDFGRVTSLPTAFPRSHRNAARGVSDVR